MASAGGPGTTLRAVARKARKLMIGWSWRIGHVIGPPIPAEYDVDLAATMRRVRRKTMTSPARVAALCDAIEYIVVNGIPGDIVECGVWRGGSMMAAALTLMRLGETERDLYLFDTFSGMTAPSVGDVSSPYDSFSLHRRWQRRARGRTSDWVAAGADAVRANMLDTGYPPQRIRLVPGEVEETLPGLAPATVALLRLDTDWYESTRHELVHLYPRLAEGGVLVIDDYGHYVGARRAVDEYFEHSGTRPLLSRIDYTGRLAIKQDGLRTYVRPPAPGAG